jgi:N-acyl-D-aspartate/D-glutamate deacylase
MVMPSRGICHTVVNGRIVYADGALTGDAGGQVLRS